MSNLPQQYTINQYTGDGITTVFNYTYLVPLDGDISVYVTPVGQDANEVADLQSLNVDYTVQDAGTIAGGTITFILAAPENGDIVTLRRTVQPSSDTNFADARTFNGGNLDDAIERETLLNQQNTTDINRNVLRYQFNSYQDADESVTNNIIPQLPEGYTWKGTASGGVAAVLVEENPDASTLRSELANNNEGTDGAGLVGYYDVRNSLSTTVRDYLNSSDSGPFYVKDTGTVNHIVINSNAISTPPKEGTILFVDIKFASTSSVDITVNGVTSIPYYLIYQGVHGTGVGSQVALDCINPNVLAIFVYDGLNWRLQNPLYEVITTAGDVDPNSTYIFYHNGIQEVWGSVVLTHSASPIILQTIQSPIAFTSNKKCVINVNITGGNADKASVSAQNILLSTAATFDVFAFTTGGGNFTSDLRISYHIKGITNE